MSRPRYAGTKRQEVSNSREPGARTPGSLPCHLRNSAWSNQEVALPLPIAVRMPRGIRILCVGLGALGLMILAPRALAEPSASITPGRGLVDRQVVTLRAAGLPPNTNIEVLECAGTV